MLGAVAHSIYIASAEGDTGKSTIALGITALLSRTVGRVGVFRPVARVADGSDYVLQLLLAHSDVGLSYEECVGVTYEAVHADADAALTQIVARYHEVERKCDAVVIVGTDYTDVAGPAEFEFNARIAANLAAPVALVVHGRNRTPAEVAQVVSQSRAEMEDSHAKVVAVFANRCDPDQVEQVKAALPADVGVAALPEENLLTAPTLRALMASVDGRLIAGDETMLSREVRAFNVGAMNVNHLLERLTDGAMVITPGDRSDAIIASLTAHTAAGFPSLAGIMVNGGFLPEPAVQKLIEGLGSTLPLIATALGTFETAARCSATRGRLEASSRLKVDTALALFERFVDSAALTERLNLAGTDVVTPLMFEYTLLERARSHKKHIVLPEGSDDRILQAAATLLTRDVVDLTILGDAAAIQARCSELGISLDGATVVSPQDPEYVDRFAREYYELRKHKGITEDAARETVQDVSFFGTMMVLNGMADGMVSGAAHTTAHTITPSFQVIKTSPGVSIVSSVFFMCLQDRVLVYGDCAVNPDPTAEQLADIAISSAQTAAQFGVEPRIAMLSYSTGESGTGSEVDKVREATRIVRERRPDLVVDGPIQYDAAVEPSVAAAKAPHSPVAGRATVLIFPDLNTGNNTYKAVQRSAGAVAVGPVLQGLRKPVNDLSRGALVHDIVNTVAITAIQAQDADALAATLAPDAEA
jgi:phosphate acetyltransferase